jgi:inner membrane protein
MDPITHFLAAVAVSRAGFNRLTRHAGAMLIVSCMAGDFDWLAALFGPRAFLIGHHTATDSIVGAIVIAIIVAACFTFAGNRPDQPRIAFATALFVCAVGAGLHVLLDFADTYGVKLLWPANPRWYALDALPGFDLLLGFILFAGVAIPMLFRMITEEIGAHPESRGARIGAIIALIAAFGYTGARTVLHTRAVSLLNSRMYQGDAPSDVGAFPDSPSPFHWGGVVMTGDALLRVDVPVAFGTFDPLSAHAFYKPQPSAALDAARQTRTAAVFLNFARFPRATVAQTDSGFRVEITDMRFEVGSPPGRSPLARIDLDPRARVVNEELEFGDLFPR